MNQRVSVSDEWPGKRIGLPAEGPRSVGRLGRRLVALTIDWGFAVIVSIAFFNYDAFATLGIFVAAQVVRTLLMALVIPAVIWDADQRGMHDRVAGTLLVRR